MTLSELQLPQQVHSFASSVLQRLSIKAGENCVLLLEGIVATGALDGQGVLLNGVTGVIQGGRVLFDDNATPAVPELLLTGLNRISLQDFSHFIHFNDIETETVPELSAAHARYAHCAAEMFGFPSVAPTYHYPHLSTNIKLSIQPTQPPPAGQAADSLNSSQTFLPMDLSHSRLLCTPHPSFSSNNCQKESSLALSINSTLPAWFTNFLTDAHQHSHLPRQDSSCQGHYSIRNGLQLFPPPPSNPPSRSLSPALHAVGAAGPSSCHDSLQVGDSWLHNSDSMSSSPACSSMHASAVRISSSCTEEAFDNNMTASWLGDGSDSSPCSSPESPASSSDAFHPSDDVFCADPFHPPSQQHSMMLAESTCLRVRQLHQHLTATLPLSYRRSPLKQCSAAQIFENSASALFGCPEYEQDLAAVSEYQGLGTGHDCYDKDLLSGDVPCSRTIPTSTLASSNCGDVQGAGCRHEPTAQRSQYSHASICEVCSCDVTKANSNTVTCGVGSIQAHHSCVSHCASGKSWTCRQCAKVGQGQDSRTLIQECTVVAGDMSMQPSLEIHLNSAEHQHPVSHPLSPTAQPAPLADSLASPVGDPDVPAQPESAHLPVKVSHRHSCVGGNRKRTVNKKQRLPYGDELPGERGDEFGGESAGDGGSRVCAQCGSSTTASHQWRRGWLLQGQHVRLCNRCGLQYARGRDMTHHSKTHVNLLEEDEQMQQGVQASPCIDLPSQTQLPMSQMPAPKKRTRSKACSGQPLILEASVAGAVYGLRRVRVATLKAKEGALVHQEEESVGARSSGSSKVRRANAAKAEHRAEWESEDVSSEEDIDDADETEPREDHE